MRVELPWAWQLGSNLNDVIEVVVLDPGSQIFDRRISFSPKVTVLGEIEFPHCWRLLLHDKRFNIVKIGLFTRLQIHLDLFYRT